MAASRRCATSRSTCASARGRRSSARRGAGRRCGCGKTTILRTLNRLNYLVPGATVEGSVRYHGADIYAPGVDPVELRRRIGMVFQRPNPFPRSIRENVAFAPRALGMKDDLDGGVERALRRAALWDEVKDRLGRNASRLSGGQQQRLCI